MKTKIVGILVCMLLIGTVFSAVGDMNRTINDKRWYLDDTQNLEFASGEFIVKFTKDAAIKSPSITMLNEKYQVSSMKKVFKNSENTILDNIYILNVPEDSDILSIVNDYSVLPNVEYAEPNGIFYPCVIPNDEYFYAHWALHNTGQNFIPPPSSPVYGTPDCDIDAPEAWDIETGNPDIVIAIIDSGVDYNHPDLADKIWVNEDEIPGNDIDDDDNGYIDDIRGWDFYYNDSDPIDGNGHGTLCAGVPGMVTDNTIGGAGVCWDCQIMPVQIADEDWYSSWADIAIGIIYAADNAADVISMSFVGYGCPSIIKDAVDYAYDKGVFLCAAAGNYGTSSKLYPAAYENVTAVAATNQHDERCDEDDWWGPGSGSNYGEWVDVAAPGNFIYTTMPTYHVSMNDFNNYNTGENWSQNYDFCYGTSLATPMVAGLAALILSKNPSYSHDKVKSIICANVDPYDSEYYLGTGRINAYKALTEFYTQLDIEITGGLGVEATITYNGLGDAIGEPYEITVTGGLLGLINKTVNGTIDIEAGTTDSISSGLLIGLGSIEITVTVGVKEEIAEGMQLLIFTIIQ